MRAVFDVIYGQGVQPDTPEGIYAMAQALGISDPDAAMSDSPVRQALRDNTQRAIAEGVFGVPTFSAGLFATRPITRTFLSRVSGHPA